MALRVWLPLNGTLENKGISNITTNGTPQYKTGKIGQYSLNIKQQISITCPQLANLQTFSICFWGMSESSDTLTGNWQDLIGFTDIHSNGNSGVFRWESGYSGYPGIHWHDNATYALTNGSATHINVHDKWCHCCVVFDMATSKVYSYANGALITTTSHLGGHFNSNGAFYLGQTNAIEGRITDVRIYDHALSAAEVKEISQGLVLHYKLDSFQGGLGNPNLYTGSRDFSGGWGNGSNWTTATETYKGFTVKQRSATWAGLHQNITCAQNDIFTISFYAKVESGGTIKTIHRSNLGNVTTGLSIIGGNIKSGEDWIRTSDDGTQWGYYWATVKIVSADITYLQWRLENSVNGKNMCICGIKLEKGSSATGWSPAASEGSFNIIQDSSGYGHNGTINGTMTITSNTARYNSSIVFNGSDNAISIPFNDIIKTDDYTVSVWTYKETIGTKNYQTILGGPSGFELEARSSSSTSPLYRIHNWGGGTTAYEFNKWNLFTFVRTANDSKLYVNGELKLTGTAGTIPSGNYFIGAWRTATEQNYDGYMSDFRIYCTALSADDILSLYHTAAKVDNLHNMHTFEYIEGSSNIKLTKQGQFKEGEIQEDIATKFYKTNNIITAKNFIES